jgi:hypothetical protein
LSPFASNLKLAQNASEIQKSDSYKRNTFDPVLVSTEVLALRTELTAEEASILHSPERLKAATHFGYWGI